MKPLYDRNLGEESWASVYLEDGVFVVYENNYGGELRVSAECATLEEAIEYADNLK